MARRREQRPTVPVDGEVPAELRDPAAAVWSDDDAFEAFMVMHGWWDRWRATRGMLEDMAGPSPRRRRRAAVGQWARDAGIVDSRFGVTPDWERLREMGLL